ncbi:restriction endonuclease subunit S [Streptomyces sp. NPDC005435]|uniref:restriction endonuclease subunit S n=1 Tax=Streptomyces sp. NPDC005435 TaxID=3154464 RepID=UPI00345531F1
MTTPVRLDSVCDITMGQAPPGDTYNGEGSGLPLIAGAGDFSGTRPAPKKWTSEAGKVCRAGDIILGIRASVGEKVLADEEYCLGRGVAGLRARPGLDPRFLWHWLTHVKGELVARGRGATFLQVNRNDIGALEMDLPGLAEQRRVAAVLDQVEELRAKRRRAIALLDDAAQSVFLDMFGDPASPASVHRRIPVADAVSRPLQNGAYFPAEAYTEDGVAMVHMSDAFSGTVGPQGLKRVACAEKDLAKYALTSDDLLVARRSLNYEGSAKPCRVGASDEPLIFESSLIRVTPDPELLTARYLYAYLSHQRVRDAYVFPLVTGATITGISQGNLAKVPVLVPPLADQRGFERRLEHIDRLRDSGRAHLATLDELFTSLRHRAFTGTLWDHEAAA